jgi:glycosyltransferase involved in cell wall biosynthesis
MPALLKQDPSCSLFIAGDGPHRPELKRIIAKHHLDDHVFLVGRVAREVVLEFAKASDIFVLNTYYEGFSHQLLEVMSVGTPVVATREGGNPELVTDCESGILIKYNDKQALLESILKIKSDKKLGEELVKCALARTRHFTKERMITGLIAELS